MFKQIRQHQTRLIGLVMCLILVLMHVVDIVDFGEIHQDKLLGIAIKTFLNSNENKSWSIGVEHAIYLGVYSVLSFIFMVCFCLATGLEIGEQKSRKKHSMYLLLQIVIVIISMSALHWIVLIQLAMLRPLSYVRKYLIVFFLLFMIDRIVVGSMSNFYNSLVNMRMYYLSCIAQMFVQAVVFGVAYAAKQEFIARKVLAATYAHLQANQILMQESVRDSERKRIARDVHDAIGHHLTALNLHLDLAQRQAKLNLDQDFKIALSTAHQLTQSLLFEVRNVVSGDRQTQVINLPAALKALCAGIPHPRIEFNYQAELKIHSIQFAHHLFSCIQEAITNAVKHARAQHIYIDVSSDDKNLRLCIYDDGCGWIDDAAAEGSGLLGIRERVHQLGGKLHVNRQNQDLSFKGLCLKIIVPNCEGIYFE